MKLAIPSINRPYLAKTLDSLWNSDFDDDVHLFVGNPDESYLNDFRSNPRVRIESMPAELWSQIKDLPDHQKTSANYLRIFEADEEHLFIAEDDVEFSSSWKSELGKIRQAKPQSLISLYSRYEFNDPTIHPCGWTELRTAWGTCGIFYPKELRKRLADFVRKRFEQNHLPNNYWEENGIRRILPPGFIPIDQMLSSYLFETNSKAVISVPSYVEHIGDITSISVNQNQGIRRATTFRRT